MNLLLFAILALLHYHVSAEGEICGAETERPRDLACLRKLWREAGCYPYGKMAPDNRDVQAWYDKNIGNVRSEMAQLTGADCYGEQGINVPPLSIGNPASQSTTFDRYVATIASRADYNCYLTTYQISFTHTLNDQPKWWAVDLQSFFLVDTVRIIARNRWDSYVGSYGIYVLQGENDIDNDASRCSRSTEGDTALTCDVRREGTHVRLLREDTVMVPLCLCKLIVYGYPSCGTDDKSGPHSMACLRKLWKATGCDVTGSSSPDKFNVDVWHAMNVGQVKASMAGLSGDRCRNSSFNISDLDAVSVGKPATQSSQASNSGDEKRADRASVAENNCYSTTLSPSDQTLTSPELRPWWSLDLEAYFRVHFVRIIARRDGSDDWLGIYDVTVGHPPWVTGVASLCQREITENDVMIHCPDGPIGAYIRIQRTENGMKSLALCKVIVYGKKACPVGKFKWPMCRETCPLNCKGSLCGLNSGDCVGCVAGKRGPKCQEDCLDDTWGENCKQDCSVGCSATCDKVSGRCSCHYGFYGSLCRKSCSKNCRNICDKLTGLCQCKPGYQLQNCTQVCDQGWYGDGCTQQCSAGCTFPCNHVNGKCLCREGYFQDRCDGKCALGCQGGCEKTTGYCLCRPGYTFMNCSSICDQGWYGDGCTQQCSIGCTSSCNHVNGTCSCRLGYYQDRCDGLCALGCQGGCEQTTGNCQCQPGYMYMNCSSVCSQGMYGDGCGQECSAGCTSPCNHVNGTCTCKKGYYLYRCDGRCAPGCKGGCQQTTGYCQCRPGYINMNCTSECPGGTYGEDCLSNCSVYCKNPDVCDHETGRCSCKDGYSGEKCETAAAPLGGIIGGTLGCVAFLVLVVLLAIILFRKGLFPGFSIGSKGRKQAATKQHELTKVLTPRPSRDPGQTEAEIPAYEELVHTPRLSHDPGQMKAVIPTYEQLVHTPRLSPDPGQAEANIPTYEQLVQTPKQSPDTGQAKVEIAAYEELVHTPGLSRDPEKAEAEIPDYKQHVRGETLYENAGISVSKFPTYFQTMMKKENRFEDEFKALPTPQVTGQLGNQPSVHKKNRFKSIVPFDWSRVRLSTTNGESASEYINASYIPGYKTDKAFIAAQGPTEHSLYDFIRMIWEQHVPLVVMVTKLVENRKTKCERYLPLKKSEALTFGHVTIRLTAEDVSHNYVSRTLTLMKDGEKRVLHHLQFVSWPDHGVPTSPTAFINFHQRARTLYRSDVGPTVVHCSVGVGRTGTFLIMDYLLQQAKAEGRLDVFTCAKTMHEARVGMVQSLDQYVFIHEALLEALHCGQCTVHAAEYVTWWAQADVSAIKRQFEVLGMMALPLKPSDTSDALKEENASKNQPGVPLPANRWRPILMTPVPGYNDYINAILVNSYKRKHAFIVTQDPMENTQLDFWRLVQDYCCTVVVSLNIDQIDEGKVKHLSLSIDSGGLPGTEAMFAILDEVKRGFQQSEEDRVLITCRKGCDISGLVLALHHVCEKLSDEQEVDVFHVVKNIRESRSQFVSTPDEYLWLHQAAADYINQYSTYAFCR